MIESTIDYIANNSIDIIAAVVGLLFLYLEYRASIWMWPVSIAMAALFIYVFHSTQLYASMTIYIYFFVVSIYGWARWMGRRGVGERVSRLTHRLPKKLLWIVLSVIVLAFVGALVLLIKLTQSSGMILYGDAVATALNVVALWMASRRWAEQWCLLVPANLISGMLLLVQGEYASSIMFFIYFVVSIFGYFNWRRMAVDLLPVTRESDAM